MNIVDRKQNMLIVVEGFVHMTTMLIDKHQLGIDHETPACKSRLT